MKGAKRILFLLNQVDEKYIEEAAPVGKSKKKRSYIKCGALAACICMVLIGAAVLYKQGISDESLNPAEPPAYFCYEGYEYVYRGYTLDSRPYDAVYIGKIVNGGNFVKEDMKGNVEGYVYMVPGDDTKAYFRWKEWDIEVDGKEPILIFQLERNFFDR